ncbi:MAG: HDOD domain-containing protein [Desulfovibrionaceae bacterium]
MLELRNTLFRAVDSLSGFPQTMRRVLELTSDIDCSQKELVGVLKRDPVFSLKILRMVNSAYYSLAQEVTSVQQASVYLGLNTLKNVALSLAVVGALPMENRAGLGMQGFWLHSLSVASAAQILGRRLDPECASGVDYFTAGLLHDVGKVIFALYAPDEYRTLLVRASSGNHNLCELEEECFGLSHAEFGERLSERWNLPQSMSRCIASHHKAKGESRVVACVTTANQVVKSLGYGDGGNHLIEQLPPNVITLYPEGLTDLAESMDTLHAEVQKARMFVQIGGAA